MPALIDDVKVYIGDRSPNCIQVNNGAYPTDAADYTKGMIVPKSDWRELDPTEYEVLIAESPDRPKDSLVGIIDLPDSAFLPLEEAGFFKLLQKDEVESFHHRTDIHQLFQQHTLLNASQREHLDYPMVSSRVIPKHAYIAPIENIFHNGSIKGTEHLDIHTTCRGYFCI